MSNQQLQHHDHTPSGITFPLCVLAHDMSVASNVGSLFRLCDALGVSALYLSGSSSVPSSGKLRKAARGAEKTVPFEYQADPLVIIERLKQEGYSMVSLELTSTSVPISSWPLNQQEKVCIIVGSESGGVIPALLEASEHTLHIPMLGHNSSMNVAMACSIAVFHITQQLSAI